MQNIDPAVLRLLGEADRAARSGRFEEAIPAYERAVALRPDLPQAHHNLAVALRQVGRLGEAADAYRRALVLRPHVPEVHNNLGNTLRDMGLLDAAVDSYRQALALRPTSPEILNNLGALLQMQGRLDEAVAALRKAVALKPDFAAALSNLIYTSKLVCDWRHLEADEQACRALVRAGKPMVPFHFINVTQSPAELLHCARQWTAARTKGVGRLPPRPRTTGERIRLGYLSAKFFQHPSAVLAAELFELHDRARFEVIAYSIGPDDGSAMRRRLEHAFDRFVDLRALDDAGAARRIREDGIDILVDLTGCNDNERVPILAWRPAPIQVGFLGYPGTLGAPFMDYVIVDPIVVPMAEQRYFAEKLVQLPDCYQPNDRQRAIAERTPSRAECGLPETGFVFCCFNNSYKLTAALFEVWMRLLRTVPGSVLWLLAGNPGVEPHLVREAAARGIDAGRLVFAPRTPSVADHLARQRLADLFLDTLPYNAHTTASDALWAGLPILTCTGGSFAGRVAASLLHAVGLDELVTPDLGAYEALALRLAAEPALLAGLRARLAANRATASLFDTPRFTRNLEAAYDRMRGNWSAGTPPEPFAVAGDPLTRGSGDE